jgi:hypothetical protein
MLLLLRNVLVNGDDILFKAIRKSMTSGRRLRS